MKNLPWIAILVIYSILFSSYKMPVCKNISRKTAAGDTIDYRPSLHFTADSNWINDPNGLVYYKGEYHLFYQHNPYGTKWGHMSWGHSTSKDLVTWVKQPIAIKEFANEDSSTTWIFSGTAVVDSFNTSGFGTKENPMPLIVVFTSHIDHGKAIAQHQSLAYSLDGKTFTRYSGNPVLDIHSVEFRDPKIFWYSPSKKWVMIVSKPDQKKIRFYESFNLKEWKYMSEFGKMGNVDRFWECPDIFQLPVQGASSKWVITVSAGHMQKGFGGMQYFTGEFDGTSFHVDPSSYPKYLDMGKDFYAGIIFNNLPGTDRRKIMIGWASNWEYASDIPTAGFRGMFAVPRELSLIRSKENDCVIKQQPVREWATYMNNILYARESIKLNNDQVKIGDVENGPMEIEYTLSVNDAMKAGIKLFKGEHEETLLYIDKARSSVILDRSKSGNISFNKNYPGEAENIKMKETEKVRFKILIDKSIIEVFVNDGNYVITDLIFPKDRSTRLELFAKNGHAVFSHVKVTGKNSL